MRVHSLDSNILPIFIVEMTANYSELKTLVHYSLKIKQSDYQEILNFNPLLKNGEFIRLGIYDRLSSIYQVKIAYHELKRIINKLKSKDND